MIVSKQVFYHDNFKLTCGKTIPLALGYETYGTLSENKDNVVLVSHYFTATSHAAGKYSEFDTFPGYWDDVIGPGKAIDTDIFFVVSCDNLCNIQVKNPNVTTTGPATINPETGRPYGLDFPVVNTLDLANSQKLLLESLGITHLKAAIGPSLGGMTAMQLVIHYPDFADKYMGVVTSYRNAISPSFQYNIWNAAKNDKNFKDGQYYNGCEPKDALLTVSKNLLLSTFSADYLEELFPRDPNEEEVFNDIFAESCYDKKLSVMAEQMMSFFDMNSFIYASRITMNHDIRHGFPRLEDALQKIKAKVLLISNRQDLLENWKHSEEMVNILKKQGKDADFLLMDSSLGHMAGINGISLVQEEIKLFMLS